MGILDRFKSKKQKDKEEEVENAAKVAKEKDDAKGAKKEEKKPAKATKSDKAKTSKKEEKKEGKKKTSGKKPSGDLPADLRGVIVHPLVTEKAATLSSLSKYVFVVRTDANRVQIRSAVRKMYGINPVSVNIVNMRGKRKRLGRVRGKRKDWKKAIVTFPKGTTIDAYEGV